jgi:hypothetical protein
MFNLQPISYEFKIGMYPMQKKTCSLNNQISMVDLTKCQIRMANLTICKSQWPLSMANLTEPWSSWWTSRIFDQMFGLSHVQKNHFNQMSRQK